MLLLIAVAGGLDATAFLGAGGVFVANQTGNATFLAMAIAGTHTENTAAAATSLLCFFGAAALGGKLLSTIPPGQRWPARLALQHLTGGFITGATTLAAISSPLGDRSNP